MCGITGIISLTPSDVHIDHLSKMSSQLLHRGPDMQGEWYSSDKNVLFGHTRLSIHDLSMDGHQPMLTSNKQGVIIFNGEIYNFKVLREKLESTENKSFRSSSDTEVLCEYIDSFGIDSTLESLEGMFAFAYFNIPENKLYLCRDRAGEKPLFYWLSDCRKKLYFSSELKSLIAGLPIRLEVDKSSLFEYFSMSYISAPKTILKDAFKIKPASYGIIDLSKESLEIIFKSYWSLPENTYDIGLDEAKFELNNLIKSSVRDQLLADVPVGAFLSGGIDSSTIVSIAQTFSPKPVKTFTIGFEDSGYNEAQDAKIVSDYLSTEHHELYLSASDVLKNIPNMVKTFDEPCGDVSMIPTKLLAQFAKNEVTVTLSGDGGDELFWGYSRFMQGIHLYSKFKNYSFLTRMFKDFNSPFHFGNKFKKGFGVVCSESLYSLYKNKSSHWLFPNIQEHDHSENPEILARSDFVSYLPDDVLFKVDRALMSCSLEGRIPFLNHRIIEFAFSLPMNLKFHNGVQKYILKEVLSDYLPREVIDRPKKGFNLPLSKWLRSELADWARELIYNSKLMSFSVIPHKNVCIMLEDHINGKNDYTYLLWDYLVMTLWLDEYC